MMMIPKWGNYPGDGGGGITLVIDTRKERFAGTCRRAKTGTGGATVTINSRNSELLEGIRV